jgi:phage tail sheath gpL-like
MLSAGTATSGVLQTNLASGDGDALFGAHSQLADAIREFQKLNTKTRLDAIGYVDVSSTYATAKAEFSGTATASGTLTFDIGGESYAMAVTSGMTAAQAAAAIEALIAADSNAVVTIVAGSSTDPGGCTLTAITAGSGGNSLALSVSGSVSGLSVTLTAFSGGTGGLKASGSVTFAGPATVAGTVYVAVGSSANRTYEVAISDGTTAATAATALATLINDDDTAPFTAAVSGAVVTITMSNAGQDGDTTLLKVYSEDQEGISWTLSGFAGGGISPSLSGVPAAIGAIRYQTITMPMWNPDPVISMLESRWNVDNAILDGVLVVCNSDTLANFEANYAAINYKTTVIFADKQLTGANHIGPAITEFNYNKAAQFAAIRALRFTDGADISEFVTSSVGALDNEGGAALASLPYFNTPMVNLPVIDDAYAGFTGDELDALRDIGISGMGNNVAGDAVICSEVVTTYKTDSSGAADTTWKYLETVDTASNVAEYMFNNLKADYSQCRLTTGDLVPGRAMANAESISAAFVGYYTDLSGADYVLTQAGEDALNYFKKNLSVSIDMSEGKVTAALLAPLVTQVRSIVVPITMSLTSVGS